MKTLLYIVFCFLPTFTFSQILTQSFNEPITGDAQNSVILDTSAFAGGMPLAIVGINKVWDFSKLKAAAGAYITNYVSPGTSTASVNFPGCTLIQNEPGLSTFLKSTNSPSTQTEVLGVFTSSFSVNFSNSALAMVYPFGYGNSLSDNLAGTFTLGPLTGNCSGKITTTAEGTGTLVLPDGFVYTNVLRIKSVQTLTATQFFVPLATVKQSLISYYDTNEKFPILSISYNAITLASGTPTVSTLIKGNSDSFIVGLNEEDFSRVPLTIFPNPSGGKIQIRFNHHSEGLCRIELRNVMSQLVKTSSTPATATLACDLSDLPPGLYQVTILKDQIRYTGKIVLE